MVHFFIYNIVLVNSCHGGFDGGSVATDGTCEKDINLSISLELNDMLKDLGFNTLLIRDTDCSVETEGSSIREKKRSDINNRHSLMKKHLGSVYLCIHQNKFSSPSIKGAQVFFTPSNDQSKALAESVQSNIISLVQKDNHRKIKPCSESVFIVNKAPKNSTAVLIECGFLSNPNELKNLKDKDYQSKLCFAIVCGLTDWMSKN